MISRLKEPWTFVAAHLNSSPTAICFQILERLISTLSAIPEPPSWIPNVSAIILRNYSLIRLFRFFTILLLLKHLPAYEPRRSDIAQRPVCPKVGVSFFLLFRGSLLTLIRLKPRGLLLVRIAAKSDDGNLCASKS